MDSIPSIVSYATLLAVALALLSGSSAEATKRVDCKNFCMKTSFTGNVGGCKCGYTLFSYKRGAPMVTPGQEDLDDSRSSPVDLIRNFEHPRQNINEKTTEESNENGYLWRPIAEVLRIPRPQNRPRLQWNDQNEDSEDFLKSFV